MHQIENSFQSPLSPLPQTPLLKYSTKQYFWYLFEVMQYMTLPNKHHILDTLIMKSQNMFQYVHLKLFPRSTFHDLSCTMYGTKHYK